MVLTIEQGGPVDTKHTHIDTNRAVCNGYLEEGVAYNTFFTRLAAPKAAL